MNKAGKQGIRMDDDGITRLVMNEQAVIEIREKGSAVFDAWTLWNIDKMDGSHYTTWIYGVRTVRSREAQEHASRDVATASPELGIRTTAWQGFPTFRIKSPLLEKGNIG
jgi:hypothetical protein